MAKFKPIDENLRELVRNTHNRSFAVRAGAGTGKTTLLIGKILSLILNEGADIEKIVAITFTKKAAAELALRLRDQLERERRKLAEKGKLSREDAKKSERLEQAYSNLERAHISTIHSFCDSLLRERPVEARIDPAFSFAEELETSILQEESWQEWLEAQMEVRPEVLRKALYGGVRLDTIQSIAYKLLEHIDLLGGEQAKFESPKEFWGKIKNKGEELKDFLNENVSDTGDIIYQKAMVMIDELFALCQGPEEEREETGFTIKGLAMDMRGGSAKKWSDVKTVKSKITEFKSDVLSSIKEYYWGKLTAELINWLNNPDRDKPGFIPHYQRIKEASGILDFNDLLLKCRDMLRDNRGVRADFQEQFSHILVDEFQDTDPLQVEIIFFLAENGVRAKDWSEVKLKSGKLFIVGDPQQSIYRFRRADIATYLLAEKKVLPDGEQEIKLTQNFRSPEEIISWVNRTFAEVFAGNIDIAELDSASQVAYSSITAQPEHRIAGTRGRGLGVHLLLPKVGMWGKNEESWSDKTGDLSNLEAKAVSALIKQMKKEQWRVWDSGEPRPVEYRDIAVLFPTSSGCQMLEQALRAEGIPYVTEGGKEFFIREEVTSVINLLLALDNPHNNAYLYAALKSPFFALPDEEIFLYRYKYNHLDYLAKELGEGEVACALGTMRELYQKKMDLSIAELLEEVFAGTKIREFYYLLPRGEQMVANLQKVLDLARSFDHIEGQTFSSFCRYLSKVSQGSEAESSLLETGEDYVQLLTVHKAKGLEFPVVFLVNLCRQYSRKINEIAFISDWKNRSFHLKIGELQTRGFAEAKEREDVQELAECLRLLYVACTRAKDYLILGGFANPERQGHYFSLFNSLPCRYQEKLQIEGCDIINADELSPAEPEEMLKVSELTRIDCHLGDEEFNRREEWLARRQELLDDDTSVSYPLLWPSAREEVKEGKRRVVDGEEKASDFDEPEVRPLVERAKKLGSAFHMLMAQLDFSAGDGAERLAGEIGNAFDLDADAVIDLAQMAGSILASSFAERVRKSRRLFKELPFSVMIEEDGRQLLMEGSIDLLFEEEGGLVLVDYKTDKLKGRNPQDVAKDYELQMSRYARAVEKTTQRKVQEMGIWLARSGEWMRIE